MGVKVKGTIYSFFAKIDFSRSRTIIDRNSVLYIMAGKFVDGNGLVNTLFLASLKKTSQWVNFIDYVFSTFLFNDL